MDTKEKTLSSLSRSFRFFLQDLETTPPAAFHSSLGGKARRVADIAYEVTLTNDCLWRHLLGEPVVTRPDARTTAPEEFATKEAAIAAFTASCDQVIRAIEQLTSEELEETIVAELGAASRADHCRSMTVHLWYHSGQVNYIQTLLGDSEVHWS